MRILGMMVITMFLGAGLASAATINLSDETKAKLDAIKIVPRETYEEEIIRLLDQKKKR